VIAIISDNKWSTGLGAMLVGAAVMHDCVLFEHILRTWHVSDLSVQCLKVCRY